MWLENLKRCPFRDQDFYAEIYMSWLVYCIIVISCSFQLQEADEDFQFIFYSILCLSCFLLKCFLHGITWGVKKQDYRAFLSSFP